LHHLVIHVELDNPVNPRHGHFYGDAVTEKGILRSRRRAVKLVAGPRQLVTEHQALGRGLCIETEPLGSIGVFDIEHNTERGHHPLSKGLPGFQVERDLALAHVENGSNRGTGEFVIGVGLVVATLQEVDSVSGLRGCEVHRSAAGDDDLSRKSGWCDGRRHSGAVGQTAYLRSIRVQLEQDLRPG